MIIDFEKERTLRLSPDTLLWDRLVNQCLSTIKSCMGEVLPCVAEEEQLILNELKRRKTKQSLEVARAYETARTIAIKQLKGQYVEIISVGY